MKKRHIIQVKVAAILDIPRMADDPKDALSIGDKIKWSDFFASDVGIGDGLFEIVGAWDNECFGEILLPQHVGLVTDGSIATLFDVPGRAVAAWRLARGKRG